MENLLELRPRTGTHISLFFQQCEREKTRVQKHTDTTTKSNNNTEVFSLSLYIWQFQTEKASQPTVPIPNQKPTNSSRIVHYSLFPFLFFTFLSYGRQSYQYYSSIILSIFNLPKPNAYFFSFSIYLTKMKYQYQYYYLCPFFFVCAIEQGFSFQLSNPKSQNQNQNQNTLFFTNAFRTLFSLTPTNSKNTTKVKKKNKNKKSSSRNARDNPKCSFRPTTQQQEKIRRR